MPLLNSCLAAPCIQAVLALVAFAASAYIQSKGEGSPMINFMVFTGVTAWLLAMFYAAVSCVERLQRLFKGAVEVSRLARLLSRCRRLVMQATPCQHRQL